MLFGIYGFGVLTNTNSVIISSKIIYNNSGKREAVPSMKFGGNIDE